MLTDLSFLEKGKPFPPDDERKRLRRYKKNKLLFEDEHAIVYKEQFKRIERVIGDFDRVASYATIFNFQKLTTLKIADFVFGFPPKISFADDSRQSVIDKIVFDTDLYNKLYMSAIDVSRYGDSVLQISKNFEAAATDSEKTEHLELQAQGVTSINLGEISESYNGKAGRRGFMSSASYKLLRKYICESAVIV